MKAATCAALGLWLACPLAAQTVSGAAVGFRAQERFLYQGAFAERTGTLVGAEGTLGIGPLRLDVSGLTGTLPASGDSTFPELRVRTTAIGVGVALATGLEIGVLGESWRMESDAANTGWRLFGATVHLAPSLGLDWLRSDVHLAYFPAAEWVSGGRADVALRGAVRLTLGFPRSGPWVRLGYRFERIDLKGQGDIRREQFQGPTAAVGVRLGSDPH